MSQVAETGTVLDRIVAQTRLDLDRRKAEVDRAAVQARFETAPPIVDVRSALDQDTVTVIAEIKRASPSKGRFPVEIDPADVARAYAEGGAAAISCLTDGPYFQGSLNDLASVTDVTSTLDRPVGVLRKDFLIDPYQVDEARANGASCILLIVACLSDGLLRSLLEYGTSLGLAVLVEVHGPEELQRSLDSGANLVGINNRDLKTLAVDLDVTRRLAPLVPAGVTLVGESGIFSRNHVEEMAGTGVDAILVGESLIVQRDRAAAVQALSGARKSGRG